MLSVIVILSVETQGSNKTAVMYSNFGIELTYFIGKNTIHLPPICIVRHEIKAKKISKL